MRDTERTLRARALLIWNLHTYHFKSIPLRIVHRAIIILSSGGGARSSSHRARAGEEALLPSSIERLVDCGFWCTCGVLEESKNKDGHGRRKRKGLGATWVASTNVRRCWRRRVRHNQRLAVLMVGFLTSYSYSSRSRRTRLACDFSSSSWGCLFSFFFPPPKFSLFKNNKNCARARY